MKYNCPEISGGGLEAVKSERAFAAHRKVTGQNIMMYNFQGVYSRVFAKN